MMYRHEEVASQSIEDIPRVMHEEFLQRKGLQEFHVVHVLIMLQKNRLRSRIFGLWTHDILHGV
jgi:hypothetical protein